MRITFKGVPFSNASDNVNPQLATGYNVTTLVALGAALVKPEETLSALLFKIVQAADYLKNPDQLGRDLLQTALQNTLGDIRQLLSGGAIAGFAQDVIEDILGFIASKSDAQAYQKYEDELARIKDSLAGLFNGFILDDLTNSSVGLIVNVYGSKDILSQLKIDGQAIGGHRESLAGFTETSITKNLVNIEILGATHFDYMRREPTFMSSLQNLFSPEDEWNKVVSEFVADLTINSQDSQAVEVFMVQKMDQGLAHKVGDEWVVTLPGYQGRL